MLQFFFLCFLTYSQWSDSKTERVEQSLTTQTTTANAQLAADEILSAKEKCLSRNPYGNCCPTKLGNPQLVDQYTELQVSQNQLQSSYQNQQLLIENLTSKNSAYQAALDQQQRAHDQKLSELAEAHTKAKAALEKRFQQASNPDNESELLGSSMGQINSKWYSGCPWEGLAL